MGNVNATEASRGTTYRTEDRDPSPHAAQARPRDIDPSAIVTSAAGDQWLAAFARGSSAPAAGTLTLGATVGVDATSLPKATPAQQRLDAYRAAFSGPYRIEGQTVSAAPQFRMADGFNDENAGFSRKNQMGQIDLQNPQVKELLAACRRAGVPYPGHCLVGGPSPRELTSVTQALIDAGKLPPGPGSMETRVKAMQWSYGIGVDCTDYVVGAAMTASQRTRSSIEITDRGATLPMPASDYFATADHNPHLGKVGLSSARPGDVFCIDSPGSVGHRAVVYSHSTASAETLAALQHQHGSIVSRFAEGGPVHVYEVDASWGAGENGASTGGVRRDTWLYNESTKEWAQLDQRKPGVPATFERTPTGPADEIFHGLYRFR